MFSSQNSQVSSAANYIEDVFSTYLYTGNGSTQTITNNIDLSTKGGLVWIKSRSLNYHALFDTARGATTFLKSNATDANETRASSLTSFNTDGFSLSTWGDTNGSGTNFASWTFRKQPKFFDVVTYTGNGAARTISHSLGSVPACIIVKQTSAAGEDWAVYHRSLPLVAGSLNDNFLRLNTTDAYASSTDIWNRTVPTSTVFSVGNHPSTNSNGASYVAYLFAHDAGGFGLTGTDNVISCGSYTASGSSGTVTLGYEPQWILIKNIDNNASGIQNWQLVDNMRGMPVGSNDQTLYPNLSNAEASSNRVAPTATGFSLSSASGNLWDNGATYIYIAIRRGPMKVPTSGTSVFSPNSVADDTGPITTNFPVDMFFDLKTTGVSNRNVFDRLRGNGNRLFTNLTDAQDVITVPAQLQSNTTVSPGVFGGSNCIIWSFRRAPSFFDEVCYSGTSATTAFNHNLTVAPELIIVKRRNGVATWPVGTLFTASTCKELTLDTTNSATNSTYTDYFGGQPTSTTFTMASSTGGNLSGSTYVAYLFATCAGVSKVGSYTGTGATQTINCGFTGGARFVLIKRTDSTGDWLVWDTARGMVSGSDYRSPLNLVDAQTNANYVYTATTGFQIVTSNASVNESGGTYIFLAIA